MAPHGNDIYEICAVTANDLHESITIQNCLFYIMIDDNKICVHIVAGQSVLLAWKPTQAGDQFLHISGNISSGIPISCRKAFGKNISVVYGLSSNLNASRGNEFNF